MFLYIWVFTSFLQNAHLLKKRNGILLLWLSLLVSCHTGRHFARLRIDVANAETLNTPHKHDIRLSKELAHDSLHVFQNTSSYEINMVGSDTGQAIYTSEEQNELPISGETVLRKKNVDLKSPALPFHDIKDHQSDLLWLALLLFLAGLVVVFGLTFLISLIFVAASVALRIAAWTIVCILGLCILGLLSALVSYLFE